MKKVIFMLAAGALALSSCSETEVIEQGTQSNAIGFTNHVGKGTRAITDENFDHFKVYGSYTMPTNSNPVDIFSGGQDVTKGSDGAWTYSPVRNWIPNATYTFAAFAIDKDATLPGQATYGAETGGNAYYLNLANVKIDGDDGHQLDIVYAKTGAYIGKTTDNNVVALKFKHILSRLDFTFKSALPEGFNAVISNPQLVSVRNTGLYDGKTLAWKNVDRTVAVDAVPPIRLSITDNDGELTGKKNVTTGNAYVIPFAYEVKNVGIKFNINITDSNGTPIITNKEVSAYWAPQWVQNNTYSYTIIINGSAAGLEPIKFTGSVADWSTGTPSTPEFNIDPQPLSTPEEP